MAPESLRELWRLSRAQGTQSPYNFRAVLKTNPGNGAGGSRAVRVFTANERANQLLIANLDVSIWSAKPAGGVRSVGAILAHMHNVRLKWLRLSAPHITLPSRLGRAGLTPQQAAESLARSAAACAAMLREAVRGGANVRAFRRDGWAKPWSCGIEMLCYMVAHESHHRGQICMLAHQLGHPLPPKITSRMWDWESLW